MVKLNVETFHTDVNAANFKIIDMSFSNNKRKFFMDRRPETYTKCTGEIISYKICVQVKI